MMNTNADNLMCEYADSVVPYLYRELPPREVAIFEAHLEHCSGCTDEFAAVADARYSVYEWHQEAFVPLATPRFVIPQEPVRVGILAQLEEFLAAARPSLAFAGALAVVLVAVVIGTNLLGPGETDIASNIVPEPRPANIPAQKLIADPVLPIENAVRPPGPVKVGGVRSKTVVRQANAERRSTVRQVEKVPGYNVRQARQAPALSDDIEIEDESLRLTDLFDEVGG